MKKDVLCGHPGCKNKFTIETEQGEPAVPYCPHHVKRMRDSIAAVVRRNNSSRRT